MLTCILYSNQTQQILNKPGNADGLACGSTGCAEALARRLTLQERRNELPIASTAVNVAGGKVLRENGVGGVNDSLMPCRKADETVIVLSEGYHGGSRASTLRVFDDLSLLSLHDGNARVRRG